MYKVSFYNRIYDKYIHVEIIENCTTYEAFEKAIIEYQKLHQLDCVEHVYIISLLTDNFYHEDEISIRYVYIKGKLYYYYYDTLKNEYKVTSDLSSLLIRKQDIEKVLSIIEEIIAKRGYFK